MNASCLDLVRALDPGECHLVEEGLVSVVTHDPRQTQAFDRFLLILGYRHAPPPQYTDQQRLIGGGRHGTDGRMAALLIHGIVGPQTQR